MQAYNVVNVEYQRWHYGSGSSVNYLSTDDIDYIAISAVVNLEDWCVDFGLHRNKSR